MARHIGQVFDKVARKALQRHGGPLMAELSRVWPELCPELAEFARPEAVKRTGPGPATLKLRVAPAHALQAQMLEMVLLQRLDAHFGPGTFGRITLVQAPLNGDAPPARRPARATGSSATATQQPDAVDAALLAELRKGLVNVRDEQLRTALEKVAEGIARRAAGQRHGK